MVKHRYHIATSVLQDTRVWALRVAPRAAEDRSHPGQAAVDVHLQLAGKALDRRVVSGGDGVQTCESQNAIVNLIINHKYKYKNQIQS